MKIRTLLAGAAALIASAAIGLAGTVPLIQQGSTFVPGTIGDFNTLIQTMNQQMPSYSSLMAGKNYLDNAAFQITQRGTGSTTGGTTSGCAVASYVADRWCIDTNVSSGDGRGQVITSTPSPPTGFQNSVKIFRNSGALTQPICAQQEIETARFVQLQGKSVLFSVFVQGLAGNTATTALTINLITGTGTDQGLGALRSAVGMTASPALTPVWTGLATNAFVAAAASPSWNIGTTAAWNRIYSAPLFVPATATEGMLQICTTPVGSSSGATDGYAFVGAQLEPTDGNQVVPSAFEYQPIAVDLQRAQRFFWQISDPANTINIPSSCNVTTANTTVKCGVWLPTQMQAVPVTAVATATSFGIWLTAGTAGTCTTLAATASSSTVNSIGVTCTTAGTIALGTGTNLIGATNTAANTLNASADF